MNKTFEIDPQGLKLKADRNDSELDQLVLH